MISDKSPADCTIVVVVVAGTVDAAVVDKFADDNERRDDAVPLLDCVTRATMI